MSKAQIVKTLKSGGKIGGHSLCLFAANGEKIKKVSRAVIEEMMSAGDLYVVNQAGVCMGEVMTEYVTVYLHMWGGDTTTPHTAESLRQYASDMGVCKKPILQFMEDSKPATSRTCRRTLVVNRI